MTRFRMGTETFQRQEKATYASIYSRDRSFQSLRLAALTYMSYSHGATEYSIEIDNG